MENTNHDEQELTPPLEETTQIEIDQQKLDDYMQRLRSEQNLPMAIVGT